MDLRSYSKVWNLGHSEVRELFKAAVQVEEKIDGSQFSFGLIDGELKARSRSKNQCPTADSMFQNAVEFVSNLDLAPGYTYRSELLNKPKHNVLAYGRIPTNNIIIYDIDQGFEDYLSYDAKQKEANRLGFEIVPRLGYGYYENWEQLKELLDTDSCLGNVKIEGIVIKAYGRFGEDKKTLMAKYVSEAFKEYHASEWRRMNPTKKDVVSELIDNFRTDARWLKAIQHKRENGELRDSTRDIGPLIGEICRDVDTECNEEIKNALYKWAWKSIGRGITAGFPEFYKAYLAERQFVVSPDQVVE